MLEKHARRVKRGCVGLPAHLAECPSLDDDGTPLARASANRRCVADARERLWLACRRVCAVGYAPCASRGSTEPMLEGPDPRSDRGGRRKLYAVLVAICGIVHGHQRTLVRGIFPVQVHFGSPE